MLPIWILDFSSLCLVVAVVLYRQRGFSVAQNDLRCYDFEKRIKND